MFQSKDFSEKKKKTLLSPSDHMYSHITPPPSALHLTTSLDFFGCPEPRFNLPDRWANYVES